jgi:CheY-like chemotaxis protein
MVALILLGLVLAVFFVWILRKSKGAALPEPSPGLLARQLIKNARVLVVDDTPIDQDLARALLEPYGLEVDCVSSGKEAQERIRAGKPKYRALFLDLHMTGMSGPEVLRSIRVWSKSDYARNIPVIAYTADATDPKIYAQLLDDGFQDALPKPVDTAKLDEVLKKWVKVSMPATEQTHALPSPAQLPQIPEVNLPVALARFQNDLSAYIRVLGSFLLNAPALISRLKGFGTPQIPLSEYIIAAHSLKGACRGIGAESLGNMAEYLEHAARREDIETIRTHNASFIKNMELFLRTTQDSLREFSHGQKN